MSIKKKIVEETTTVDAQIVESAKRIVLESEPRKTFDCRVCGESGATEEAEGLCWVCRRLKISAWREVEIQLPMNE